ncbi:MAG: endonuclease/exonuclease/phosphatase family protein [Candidatus Omnitrophica bacterium]|nr:endonuclease/exonuclease/phosphatase family protein [Candidatus Omnitrophota bacterium]
MSKPFGIKLIFLFLFVASGCSLAKYGINYCQTDTPRFADYSVTKNIPLEDGQIKVVSYNIKFAKKIDEAISILNENKELKDADIIFLQEMDEIGAEKIARTLNYNYIYYPAVFHPIPKQNFGNAILSKWPIISDSKIILSVDGDKKLQRIAASATLDINGKKLMAFSVHMRISIKPFLRSIQTARIVQSIPNDVDYVIVAGDFNTFTQMGYFAVVNQFEKNGFTLATKKIGWTFKYWYTANKKFTLDHIFTKGMKTIDYGKVNNHSASDHIPIWADFSLK